MPTNADGLKRESEMVMKKIVIFITLILALMMCMASCAILPRVNVRIEGMPKIHIDVTEPEDVHICRKSGHIEIVDPEIPPTCTETGLTEGSHCAVCGVVLKEQYILPASHRIVLDASLAPTCTQPGFTGGTHCTICNQVLIARTYISPIGHSVAADVGFSPTCTKTGLTYGTHCFICKEILVEQTVIDALGHNFVDGVCTRCNEEYVDPYVREGNYIYFGEYPQTIKADDVTITNTQDNRGYYLGSDGYYYAKVTANPCESGYTFSTGASVTSGMVYYFKVEPIRWRILSEDGQTALIFCDSIIANHRYDDATNNYAESEIRQWLNETFYKTAFNELQREIILTTTVDNSVYSTGYSSNPYACEDTEDKIFLLSFTEVTNSAYGFASDNYTYDIARIMQTSDYSRATGVYMSRLSDDYGNGYWWLRSPNYYYNDLARGVDDDGRAHDYGDVDDSDFGVVAALQIRL